MRNGHRYLLLAGLGITAVKCGGGTSENGGGGGSGFTAVVEGHAWEATPISIAAQAVGGVPGALLIVGSQTSGGLTTSLTITLYNVTGPGSYALGVSSSVYGGIGQLGEGTGSGNGQSWITDNIGTAGTVTITTLGGGRIAGTFEYTTVAGHSNTVGGTRTVTNGAFDLAFTGTITPVPDNVGSKVTAEFDGEEYNAWSVSGLLQDHLGGPGFQFSSSTKEHGVSILISGVTAPGTFTLSNTGAVAHISAGHNGGNAGHCCWGGGSTGDDVGTITITSLTASRAKGTFSATLQPVPGKPATTPLVITDAAFDVGIN